MFCFIYSDYLSIDDRDFVLLVCFMGVVFLLVLLENSLLKLLLFYFLI